MKVPYTSRHLTELAHEAGELSRKEQITTARAKTLFVRLQGDSAFAPTALAAMGSEPFHDPWANNSNGPGTRDGQHATQDTEMLDILETSHSENTEAAGRTNGVHPVNGSNGDTGSETVDQEEPLTNGIHDGSADKTQENREDAQSPSAEDGSDTASQQTAHRMTTRARAHAASTPSPPHSPSSSVNAIHPLFTFSTETIPDRDCGLPANEAEEARIMLMAYVQKQDEVARITSDLYQGLLQADRMRQDVFKWSKAEAHVGEMSDGEDWYDKEEWGLEQDLAKGRDEEDDDTAVAGKKSTRQRRKPDKDDR